LDEIGIAVVLIVWLLAVLLILVLLLRHSNKKTMRKIAELREKIDSLEALAVDTRKKVKEDLVKKIQALEKELKNAK